MSDLIRKAEVMNALYDRCTEDCEAISCDYHFFKNLPTVDAEPVRHGHWGVIAVGINFNTDRLCSHCKKEIKSNYWNYCPNCGAKMDEVVNK